MSARKRGKGGRHVAIERGLRPDGSGWPFRRERGELATLSFSLRQRPAPSEIPILNKKLVAHTARLGGSAPGQVDGIERTASDATQRAGRHPAANSGFLRGHLFPAVARSQTLFSYSDL